METQHGKTGIHLLFGALLLCLILLVTLNTGSASVSAQPPFVTEAATAEATVDNPFAGIQSPTPTTDGSQPVDPTPSAEIIPTETEVPSLDDRALEIAVRSYNDLETLASATIGVQRPEGWNGALSPDDTQFALLTRLNLEILAGQLVGANNRPAGWFGVVGSTPYALARDIRHDVELLADTALAGQPRPAGWLGDEPLMQCDRPTQAAVQLLELNGVFTLQADRTAADFCQQAAIEVSVFMEVNLLANPLPNGLVMAPGVGGGGTGTHIISETFAVAFLDRGAATRVGVVPLDTPITPIARSYVQFSAMMLVRGDGFEVFVDRNTTSVTREEFDALPNVDDSGRIPFCDVSWCEAAG